MANTIPLLWRSNVHEAILVTIYKIWLILTLILITSTAITPHDKININYETDSIPSTCVQIELNMLLLV